MTHFLSEVADYLLTHHQDRLGDCTVIFPNRRAGLFLKKQLSAQIEKPVWSPDTVSLEDFLFRFSPIKKTDSLTLIFELFNVFKAHQAQAEGFESFYFWGEMLLKDFEEVDHYLIEPGQLFKYIKDDRQLAEDFYFLDEAHEAIIRKFWKEFFPEASRSQVQFMETWKILLPVYEAFKRKVLDKGIGYTGLIYRELSEQLKKHPLVLADHPFVFAGFNALTPAEEFLMKYFVQHHHAEVLWDMDAYYVEDDRQEAGDFLRKYQNDAILGPTFPERPASGISKPRKIPVTGVSLEVGQAKLIGEQVRELLATGQAKQEEIVVVLPQDYMLFPVLNAMPPEVTQLNVTMGYPLKETPLFGLLEACIELQENTYLTPEAWISFYHKQVIDVLSHPYLYEQFRKTHDEFIAHIKRNNQVRVLQQDLLTVDSPFISTIFRQVKGEEGLATYLLSIIESLVQHTVERFGLEREFMYHFRQLLSRLDEILKEQSTEVDLKTFKSLFGKASRSVKIPFSGEPIEGLQVMGVLETRNLDFKYVLMLNMNEGIFPAAQKQGSFIPYRIRKAFDLPTFELQDAIYAYLFYRLIQRAAHLSFYYNMYADFGLSGEVSRFIRQLEWESPHTVSYQKLNNPVRLKDPEPITIQKTEDIIKRLKMYTASGDKKLSPSALNVYLECRLQFYFKYVLRLFEPDDLSDELAPRDFGNVMHKALELLYEDATKGKPHKRIEPNDFFRLKSSVGGAIELAFRDHFKLKKKQKFEVKGRNVVLASIIERYVSKVLEMDESYAPFEIKSLENDRDGDYSRLLPVTVDQEVFEVSLKGIIDRVDRKDGTVRVIDYKSGKDTTEMKNLESVLDRDSAHRNKAGFQTMYYAWLYASKYGSEDRIIPGIFNIQELFVGDFDFRLKQNGRPVDDARPYLAEFEERFTNLLAEIYDRSQPFDQTENELKCVWCDFKGICERG